MWSGGCWGVWDDGCWCGVVGVGVYGMVGVVGLCEDNF